MKVSPRHLVWVNLVLLALVAYWGASTVSTAIAAKLTLPPEVHLKPPPAPIPRDQKRPVSYYASINARDIFNSVREEPTPAAAPAVITKLNVKLWGVSIHTNGRSQCIIEDQTSHKQDVYGIGDTVAGVATVKQIEWERVILDRGGQEEILELAQAAGMGGGAGPGRMPPVAAVAPPAAPDQPVANAQNKNPHIQQVSDTEYRIDRTEVDSQLENMNQLFTQIRAVPHFDGGKSTGFRLFAIRQDSLFDQLGLHNGDIIENINGQDLSDPSRAMGMLAELHNMNQVSVKLLRNKEEKTLTVNVNNK